MNKQDHTEKSFVETILDARKSEAKIVNDGNVQDVYTKILNWTELSNCNSLPVAQIISCLFIFDYMRSEMIYFSPSVRDLLGVESNGLLGANGIIKFMDLVNPNDFNVYNNQIFPKDIAYLRSSSFEDAEDVVFSNNFRMKQSNGLYKNLLMKKVFISDPETRQPLLELGSLTDISSFKKELSITHTIERMNDGDGFSSYLKVVTEDYFPEMHANILSAREKEILSHLSMGTKRKEVGVKLFITDNTVANHIKTILRKTNSQNIREAIAICKMNGII
jgi:DNA-binding CsgD family transcriptional regulator